MSLLELKIDAFNILIWHQGKGKQTEFTLNAAIVWFKQYLFNCKKAMSLPEPSAMFDFILKQAHNMHVALTSAKRPSMFNIFNYPEDFVSLETGLVQVYYR